MPCVAGISTESQAFTTFPFQIQGITKARMFIPRAIMVTKVHPLGAIARSFTSPDSFKIKRQQRRAEHPRQFSPHPLRSLRPRPRRKWVCHWQLHVCRLVCHWQHPLLGLNLPSSLQLRRMTGKGKASSLTQRTWTARKGPRPLIQRRVNDKEASLRRQGSSPKFSVITAGKE